ncbi:MAG: transglutaminase-like domain-containing protein, partial [Ruminococcus sp.]|nr:transglutaminase-like domain-containing protein [Ruminococcus sp.]
SASDIIESVDYYDEKISHYRDIIKVNLLYDSFRYELLDYGSNEKIYSLAQEITEGLDSDYDKAKALEWYFIENNYTYDLNYRKEVGENAEDFLFRTKKGVCYEYATAMTLLARACGIPARFCEGFNMNKKYENSKDKDLYVITPQEAHGFPELYIKGFGWVTFEPTMTWDSMNQETNDRNASGMLSKAGLWILVWCIFALILIISYPVLAHKFFSLINNRKRPNEAVAGVIHRICRLYKIPVSCTTREAEKTVKRVSGADISTVATLFERAEYGGAELSEEDKTKAMEEYISAYEALRESIKEKRRQKHKK